MGAANDEDRQRPGQGAGGQDDGSDQGVGDGRIADPLSGDRPPLVLQHGELLVEMPALGVDSLLQGLLIFD
jgi:hypothetical protein